MAVIEVDPTRALFSVLQHVIDTSEEAHVALATYLDGAGTSGPYRIELTGARLVPVEK